MNKRATGRNVTLRWMYYLGEVGREEKSRIEDKREGVQVCIKEA